ncbi:phosphoenolpyruvate carboxylase [Botrimarina hoheduenensis]|uniref:Phosphoenolpyruvate carboxylase n=1 Tax=Botrimarina hoheduenensis TaxID=2528000 RepID=A0A5C5WET3_9BACT|nr:phosphoenolpyruvate carboxylase [Botrimarina hoheduenensis]TWT48565.1 Phosphoenolpyruvate carboxylase [Botrimarina hoheduenensis]
MASDQRLRREIDELGRSFGDTVRQHAGEEVFQLVERIRSLAKRFCEGEGGAADEIDALLRNLSADRLRLVTRSFGAFLELANLAEDRQRVRALRDRERQQHPRPRRESVLDAIASLREEGWSAEKIAAALERVNVELVFTAHPTEAKRKSLRAKLRELRRLLSELDRADLTPRESATLSRQMRCEITKLWQTDVIRPSRPTVLEEVQRGLSFKSVLWRTVPRVMGELREALADAFPETPIDPPTMLRFGSWMGGDRDGHPYVTPAITEQTLVWLREAAIERHQVVCERLMESLSVSVRQAPACSILFEPIATACAADPTLIEKVDAIPPLESPRRWLRVIGCRLEATAAAARGDLPDEAGYRSAEDLAVDVRLLRKALTPTEPGGSDVGAEVQSWLDQIATFGLHTARLDIRQHADVYRGVMEELWAAIGLLKADEPLDESRRQQLLLETLPIAANIAPIDLSETAQRTLQLFRVLRRSARRFGGDCLGGHVISMTRYPSDLLTVLWLWTWSKRVDGGRPEDDELHLPVVPLFETISDLREATQILGDALAAKPYRDHVAACADRQIVMIGYSDSTKDGGYLAAAWALQSVQIELHELAAKAGVRLTFFHGRGGSLGRGGGPAARSILSLPAETFDGSLRLTEQGEVLAERYDDEAIAHRHLEQVLWAVLRASTRPMPEPADEWREHMEAMADASLAAYRCLVDHPQFTRFFRLATPIAQIEALPIGSRPSKRKKGDRIEDLRAIPWVFSWTQSRCLLPGWYGLGAGLERRLAEQGGPQELRTMYRDWPFFRATIDNAAMALAKSNQPVFDRYAALAGDEPGMLEIVRLLDEEYERSCAAVLAVTESAELMDTTPWLKDSIKVRNRYVDPLNLVQIETTRRLRELPEGQIPPDELQHLSQLTIKAVAAGMRTTG